MLFIAWVHSFTRMLPYVKFAEDKVLVIVVLHEKCKNSATVSLTLICHDLIADWSLPILFAGSGHALIRQLAN